MRNNHERAFPPSPPRIGKALLAASLSVALPAIAADTPEETLVVTAGAVEPPGAPLQGMVAKSSAAGTKTAVPLIKTPQTISVVTRDQMDALGVTSVADALNYTSGAFTNYRGSSNRNDEVVTRGFRYAPKFLDGLSYGLSGQGNATGQLDPWLLERVELVKGPASVLYGQVNPGGLIAMTSKRPTALPIHKLQIRGGNQHLGEVAFDFGGVLNDDSSLLYRLNGIASTQHQFVKDYKQERVAIAPALTWLPNGATSFTLLTSYQNDPKAGYRNFLPQIGTVTPTDKGQYIPYDLNVSDPGYNQAKREQISVGWLFDHNINDNLTLVQNLRYSTIESKDKYLVYTWSNPEISQTSISRRAQREKSQTDELAIDTHLNATFMTAEISHNLIGGFDYKWSKHISELWRVGGEEYNLDWANPVYGIPIDESQMRKSIDTHKKLDQAGLYLQDQLMWRNWNLLLSGRQDWSEVRTDDRADASHAQQNDSQFTGRAALLYAFDVGLSPYISYSTSFEPNLERGAPGTAPFSPTTGRQTEVGLKFQPPGSDTLLSLSLFDIAQKNITSYNSVIGYNEQIGKVRSKGVETELHAQLTPAINLIASYTFTDSTIKQSNNAAEKGKTPAALPEHMAAIWGSYRFLQGPLTGLTLGTGARYTGTSYGDNSNSFRVPARTLYDLMARYDLTEISAPLKGATLQFNVNNLTDKHYVASCSGSAACFYGSGRSMFATLSYSW
ncbi:TonB-dependent siderophore receptor [Mixta intestinalis]|jgi:iron complex outermembrane receptor protein|uniref:Ferrichrome-iron receptor n=1 Tax=Mixta intestinalis TaxID=1615494 RepID=A0A6P1PYS5_9GAMM|nr:TonB-dependent siderophore receptor [Mixta intestinalis]QHM71776.1 Ferrichrome-iron receptor [Mixta intestinalis]